MTQYIILGLVAFVAVLVFLESRKRGPVEPGKKRPSTGGQSGPSADEAGPTQSGRFRAMKVKAEIQRARQAGKKEEKPAQPAARGDDLPDPFNVELQDGE